MRWMLGGWLSLVRECVMRLVAGSVEYLYRDLSGLRELLVLLEEREVVGFPLDELPEAVVSSLYGDGEGPWAAAIRKLILLGRRPYAVRFKEDYRELQGWICEVDDGRGYRVLDLRDLELASWLLRERSPPELVEHVRCNFERSWPVLVLLWMRNAVTFEKRVGVGVEVLGGSGVYVMVRKRGSAVVRAHLSASGLVLGETPDAFQGERKVLVGRAYTRAPDVRVGRWESYLGGSFMRVLGVREGRVEVWRSWDAERAVKSGGAVILSEDGSIDCPALRLFEPCGGVVGLP